MGDYDPAEFGKRARAEFNAAGKWKDLRAFQKALRDETGGARGTTYGSVWSYVNGEGPANPQREVVQAMARLFSVSGHTVRADYLLYGGMKTEEEAAEQRRQEAAEGAELYDQLREAIPPLAELDYAVHAALMTYLQRWVQANIRAGLAVEPDDLMSHMERVWGWAMEPFKAWGRRTGREPLDLSPYGASDYMMAVLHALNFSLQVAQPPATAAQAAAMVDRRHSDEPKED